MLDKHTTLVTYHDWRGEPRGKVEQAGDCIDCNRCVNVCPMGIDIRDGLQMACIGCGLCVDACDDVMDKLEKPRGLIGYDSIEGSDAKKEGREYSYSTVKAKTVLFGVIFLVISSLMLYSLLNKSSLDIAIGRDRGALFTLMPDGNIRNTYNISVTNKSLTGRGLSIEIMGIENAKIKFRNESYDKKGVIYLEPKEDIKIKTFVIADTKKKSSRVKFLLSDTKTGEKFSKKSIFIAR